MSFWDAFGKMMVLLFAIAVGYAANRLGYLGSGTDGRISKLILNLTMPALILASVATGSVMPDLAEILSVLKVSAVFYGLGIAAALLLSRLLGGTPQQIGVWRFALAFPNVGFIGIPVATALFGQEALFYAVIFCLPFNVLSYTLGPLMLAGVKRFSWKQLCSPCVIMSFLALTLALTGFRLPQPVGEALDFVGGVTVPLSLLLVGSLLAGLPAGQLMRSVRLWILSALRLFVLPAVLWLILRTMDLSSLVLGIAVTQMAMPVGINGTLLSMEYGGDQERMAQVTFLTTLASIVTIPAVAAVLL